MQALKMLLSSIRIDGGTQPRASIDQAAIADYAEALKCGTKLPPAVVFSDGTDHWLADGFHRYHGARNAGLDSLLVEIHEGTKRDAVLYSVGANATNGLRRTNDDKRKAVTTLLQDDEWRQWSNTEIATACHVTPRFVDSVRSSLGIIPSDKVLTPPGVPAKAAAKAEQIRDCGGEPRYYKDKHGNTSVMDVSKINARRSAKAAEKKQAKEEAEQRAKDVAMTQEEMARSLEEEITANRELREQIKSLTADDIKKELAKQITLRKQSEQSKGVAMNQLAAANTALTKFGKHFDELRKITGAQTNAGVVEAVRVAFQKAA
jgi:hypothetical protein